MTRVLMRSNERDTQREREREREGHMKVETELRSLRPQVKEPWSHQTWKKQVSALKAFRGSLVLLTL